MRIELVRVSLIRFLERLTNMIEGDGRSLQRRYPHYEIGRGTYGWPRVYDWQEGTVLKIGSFCSISKNVTIFLGGDHRSDWVSMYPFAAFANSISCKDYHRSKGNVTIGNDVWIGFGASVLSGVRIGNGAVVAARAVITSDVPAYTIVAGNPARAIRKRFSDDTIAALEAIQWWEWPSAKIESARSMLMSSDIDEFIRYAEAP